jgi:hypothetical protein
MVEYNIKSGHVTTMLDELKKSISTYQKNREKIKIGITAKPEQRWAKHSQSDHEWEKMIILYQTKSHSSVCKAESELIEWAMTKYSEKCKNRISGGGGVNEPLLHDKFYLYLLLK